jgi:competence protein ComEC
VVGLLWLLQWQAGISNVVRLLRTHAFIAAFMVPLGAVFFAGASLVAMPANLVMIPVIGWIVVPLSLLAVLCYWCGWGLESMLWQLAAWPLELLLPRGQAMVNADYPWLYIPLVIDLVTALLGLLATALLVLPRSRVLKCGALLLAIPMCLPYQSPSATASPQLHVTVLDVGQGTAVVVRAGRRALLYDTGGGNPDGVTLGSTVVLPFLWAQGIATLDTLVISHNDLDHSAGLATVLDAVPVARLRYGPNVDRPGHGTRCVAGEAWRWPGGQRFQFLSPAVETPARSNDGSCVLQITVGEHRLLLPGDIEAARERVLARFWRTALHSHWLLAGHHGSRTSSSHAFLKQVDPQLAVVSSGYQNRFGHPHPAIVARLQQRGTLVLSTAAAGAIEFTLAPGKPVTVLAYRDLLRRYWL